MARGGGGWAAEKPPAYIQHQAARLSPLFPVVQRGSNPALPRILLLVRTIHCCCVVFPLQCGLSFFLVLLQRGVEHVLVEGGPSVARGFLSEGLVDRAVIIRAPVEFSRPVPSDISTDTLQRLVCFVVFLTTPSCTRWFNQHLECRSSIHLEHNGR